MSRIGTPLKCPELNLQPEDTKGIELTNDMIQVLSLLTGFWHNKRVLLKCSPHGTLFTSSPEAEDCKHITATSDAFAYQGEDVPCTDLMVMAHPDNTGVIWVQPKSTAANTKSWPLSAKEVINLTLTNLSMLHILIETNGEKAILLYTQ